jgi:uncharacterized protein YdeI (YjbR/CyaY-like superfamily)
VDVPELLFSTQKDFHMWLCKNAETSDGVWLIFSKTKDLVTLTANDALEEALCFGWIDGQMKSIDNIKYKKYFTQRRANSPWSEKNKKIAEMFREKKLMNKLGEKAIETAVKSGKWNVPKHETITVEQVEMFAKKLRGISIAYENFNKMSFSVRQTYTRRYLSFKTEEARQKDFEKIVGRLNKNLRPM